MFHLIRQNSLRAGIISGMLLAVLTAGIIAFNPMSTSAATISSCSNQVSLSEGSSGECVRLAQQLLAQQGYFKASTTGYFGPITKRATVSFQTNHGLVNDGYIGPKTWSALGGSTPSNSSASTTTTTTTPVANKAYSTSSSSTTSFSSLPVKCQRNAKTICIVKSGGSHATLYAIQNKQILRQLEVRTGDARGPAYVTTNGNWSIGRKYTMWYSKEFNNAEMPYSMFFHGGEAIHYSQDFHDNGYGGHGSSAGCVNVKSMDDAIWLYNWAPIYTSVFVVG